MTFKVTIGFDGDIENPCDNDGWKLYSFNSRHGSYRHPNQLGLSDELNRSTGLPTVKNPGLLSKLRAGLAFHLSYFEHGQCVWFLNGEAPAGVEFQWDGTRVAGLLVWEDDKKNLGPKTLKGRKIDAASFLESYTSWANGDGYHYTIEDEDGNTIDSCGGFLGCDTDFLFDSIQESLNGKEFEVEGEAKGLEDDLRRYILTHPRVFS